MLLIASFILVGVVLLLVIALKLARDVHCIRSELLPDIRSLLLQGQPIHFTPPPFLHVQRQMSPSWLHVGVPQCVGAFVIWVWHDGEWRLKPGIIPPGFDPGLPPAYPGEYNGDHAKTWVSGLLK